MGAQCGCGEESAQVGMGGVDPKDLELTKRTRTKIVRMHTDEPDEQGEGEDVQSFRKALNRRFSKNTPKDEEMMK